MSAELRSKAPLLRWSALALSLLATAASGWLFVNFAIPDGWSTLDWLRLVLSSLCVFWLAWGASGCLLGLLPFPVQADRPGRNGSTSRTAILVPIYNEDPPLTFARVAAMGNRLAAQGLEDRFDIFLLSDTTEAGIAAREVLWLERLVAECAMGDRILYRRREQNSGRKAGNIEEFIRRSGAAYDYALVLDADSLMEAQTIIGLVERMDASPRVGLLQTLPTIIRAQSMFGRVMQFAASYYSPVHAAGAARLQGSEGVFWGHNAIFRVAAFAQCCGLPELPGKPPFGGHILSHDFVEAALLARGGWQVLLDPAPGGSFEEGPENIIDYAKRDRRWCQGNLQHHRVLLASGLRLWNRVMLLQGIMAYLISPIWLILLLVTLIADGLHGEMQKPAAAWAGWSLIGLIAVLLVLPKLLIVVRGMLDGRNRRFGGSGAVAISSLSELVFSSLLAPITLLFQARAVVQVIFGLDAGWPASNRTDGRLTLRQSWAASYWIVLIGGAGAVASFALAPGVAGWSLIMLLPMIAAPLLINWSSRPWPVAGKLWRTPEEMQPSPVMQELRRIHGKWRGLDGDTLAGDLPLDLKGAADAPG
jgi:membrane glycosyltransferase